MKHTTDHIINDHIISILTTISQNPVTNVIAGFGSGKSTTLPVKIAENKNSIMVVVSSDVLANSLIEKVKSITDISVSNNITGKDNLKYISRSEFKNYLYKILSSSNTKNNTKTNSRDNLFYCDILMIDQADIQSIDDYMISAIWRYFAERNGKVPRLLLTSSTPVRDDLYSIKYYIVNELKENGYTDIRYANKDYSLHAYQDKDSGSSLIPDTLKLIYNTFQNTEGHILVFAPSKTTVGYIGERLQQIIPNSMVKIYQIHEDIEQKDIDNLYNNNIRKIIISDRTGETALVPEGVETIIDMMLDYVYEGSHTGGRRYNKTFISQQQAERRSNRKNIPGICYRMMTENTYTKLKPYQKGEIYNVPIDFTIMSMINENLDPYDILLIDSDRNSEQDDNNMFFNKNDIDYSYNLLINLGIIGPTGNITSIGEFVQALPYGVRQGTILYHYINSTHDTQEINRFLYSCIVILSMIDIFDRSYYIYPYKLQTNKVYDHALYNMETINHRSTYFEPFAGRSDLHTYGYIWNTLLEEVDINNITDVMKWCDDNYIYFYNILEVINLTNMVINILKPSLDLDQQNTYFDFNRVLEYLDPILKQVYNDKKLYLNTNSDTIITYLDEKIGTSSNSQDYKIGTNSQDYNGNVYKIDSLYAINTIETESPDIIYGIATSVISSDNSSDFRTIAISYI
jgi:hypothetical protein